MVVPPKNLLSADISTLDTETSEIIGIMSSHIFTLLVLVSQILPYNFHNGILSPFGREDGLVLHGFVFADLLWLVFGLVLVFCWAPVRTGSAFKLSPGEQLMSMCEVKFLVPILTVRISCDGKALLPEDQYHSV